MMTRKEIKAALAIVWTMANDAYQAGYNASEAGLSPVTPYPTHHALDAASNQDLDVLRNQIVNLAKAISD